MFRFIRSLIVPQTVTVLVIGAFLFGSSASAVVFTDSTFNNADWTGTQVDPGGGGFTNATQVLDGGPSGVGDSYRSVVINDLSGPIWRFEIRIDAVYDPAVSGAITTIDYSEAALGVADSIGPGGGAALKQSGKFYFAFPVGDLHTNSETWVTQSVNDLASGDFRTVADGNDHPDFSTSGAPITFGYNRHTASRNYTAGIDNWVLTVIPEPSTALLVASGLAVMAVGRRRRAR